MAINIKKIDQGYAEQIRQECMNDDPEIDHQNADELLLDLLESLGFDETTEAFKNVSKYYA